MEEIERQKQIKIQENIDSQLAMRLENSIENLNFSGIFLY